MTSIRAMAAAAALAAGWAVPAMAEEPDADTVLAIVDGTEITLGHVIVAREDVPEQFQQMPDDALFGAILEQLVQQTALADSVADRELSRRDRIALENDERQRFANMALTEAADAATAEEALRAAYEERYADAGPEREYNAAHILVETEEEAAALRAELDEGADFAELAEEHSGDASASRGGDLGWFGRGRMVEPFENAVIALEEGEVSQPVETDFGWHLIRLVETREAEVPEFEAAREELAAQLQQDAVRERIEGLTEAADVELMTEGVDPSLMRDGALLEE